MTNLLKGLALSISMLSTLPFFKVHNFFRGINGYAVMFYPLVGFIIGSILVLFYKLLYPYLPTFHLGIIIFGLWVLLTGALHLDGFCDTIDGFFVPKDKALKVMKDPHNGGMGMIFGGVFLILKASSVAFFMKDVELFYYLLPLILMLARFNSVIAIFLYPYISKSGMGTLAKEEFKTTQFIFVLLYVIALGMWISPVLIFISFIVLAFVKYIFIKRYGGFNGDMYGFLIELSELILLNTALIGFSF
jgi:cobalamin 5'-phosphate synthase/cobalamin synthase